MKRLFFFLISIVLTNVLFAQTDNYKIAIENFQTNYNAEKQDEIFNSFSQEMKQALPIFPEPNPENCENPEELESETVFRLDDVQLSASDTPSTLG